MIEQLTHTSVWGQERGCAVLGREWSLGSASVLGDSSQGDADLNDSKTACIVVVV